MTLRPTSRCSRHGAIRRRLFYHIFLTQTNKKKGNQDGKQDKGTRSSVTRLTGNKYPSKLAAVLVGFRLMSAKGEHDLRVGCADRRLQVM